MSKLANYNALHVAKIYFSYFPKTSPLIGVCMCIYVFGFEFSLLIN